MHNDGAHGVPWPAVHVEHHPEALRRRDIQRRVVAGFREPALAGGDERAGEEVSVGEALAEVRGHRRGLARLRQDGEDGVGVLAGDVETPVVAEFYIEGVDHRRNVLGSHHHIGEMEHVAAAVVPGNMAVLAPGASNVEIVADQRESAGDVQRVRLGRPVEEQRMRLAGSAVILEDADKLSNRRILALTSDQLTSTTRCASSNEYRARDSALPATTVASMQPKYGMTTCISVDRPNSCQDSSARAPVGEPSVQGAGTTL